MCVTCDAKLIVSGNSMRSAAICSIGHNQQTKWTRLRLRLFVNVKSRAAIMAVSKYIFHITHTKYNQRRTFLDLWKCHIFVHANLLNPNNVTVVDGWSLFLYENERVRNNKFVSFYKPFSRSSTSLLTSDFSETFWRRSLPRSVLNKWSLGFREAKHVISTIEIIWKQCT